MWEVADRPRFMSRREMAQEINQLNRVIAEQKIFINELKEDLAEARREKRG